MSVSTSTNKNQRSIWVRSGARYAVVPREALISPTITAMEKLTLCCLCLFQNTEGQLWPLQKKLAEMLGCTSRTVKASIKGLSQKGWLKREYDRPKHRMVYDIQWENNSSSTAGSGAEKQVNVASPAQGGQVNVASPGRGSPLHFDTINKTIEQNQSRRTEPEGVRFAHASEGFQIQPGELPKDEPQTQGRGPGQGLEVEQQDGFRTTKSPDAADHEARLDGLRDTGASAITKSRAARDEQLRRATERKSAIVEVFGKSALNGRKPSPDVEELGICYSAEFKAMVGAAPAELSGKERGQLGNLSKRLGVAASCEVIKATFSNWPKLSRQWRQAGVPKVGTILLHVDDVWAFVKSGGKTFGFTPTETRDEKERRLQDRRDASYSEVPTSGWGVRPKGAGTQHP